MKREGITWESLYKERIENANQKTNQVDIIRVQKVTPLIRTDQGDYIRKEFPNLDPKHPKRLGRTFRNTELGKFLPLPRHPRFIGDLPDLYWIARIESWINDNEESDDSKNSVPGFRTNSNETDPDITNSYESRSSNLNSKQQKAILCKNCTSNLCEACQQVLTALAQRKEECDQIYNIS